MLENYAEITTGSIVSANYFDALGVRPILGRGFEAGEDVGSSSHPLVVISYQMWRKRFKGDPDVIGKMQRLDNVPYTIIGVAPEGFYGTFVGGRSNFGSPRRWRKALTVEATSSKTAVRAGSN